MKYSEEVAQEVIAALTARNALNPCPLCGVKDWMLGQSFYFLPAQKEFPSIAYTGAGQPCAGLVCKNCGNVLLINLLALGLRHLWEREKTDLAEKVE